MSVATLEWDEWNERVDRGSSIANPIWEQVEEAICRLDGKNHTIVTLRLGDESYMMIAGGWQGCYLVIETNDNMTFSNLADPLKSDNPVMMDIGGQPGEYAQRRCVSFTIAMDAANTYFETGQLKTGLTWERD